MMGRHYPCRCSHAEGKHHSRMEDGHLVFPCSDCGCPDFASTDPKSVDYRVSSQEAPKA